MPYKTTSKTQFRKNIKKSIVVGLVMLFFDFIAHYTIGNPETISYFIAKPIIAGLFAYMMFNKDYNIFELKKDSISYYLYYTTSFSFYHGLYYRIIELIYSKPLFSRVGDIHIGTITFKADTIWQGIFAWWIIHGGAFLISIFIVNFLEKKKWLK